MIKRALILVTLATLAGCARPAPRHEPHAPPRHCDCGKEPLRSPAANDGVQRWG